MSTLRELINQHNLKPGDKVMNKHIPNLPYVEILHIGEYNVFVRSDTGREELFDIFGLGWGFYSEPKVPLTLDCEVEWAQDHSYKYPVFIGDVEDEALKPFLGKRTRMVLTEILEDREC